MVTHRKCGKQGDYKMASKKPVIIYSAADINNFSYAVGLFNSITKFHSPKDIDMVLYTNETRPEQLQRLPKGVRHEDITKLLKDDPAFWYRQKPILSEPLLDEYECVIGMDADQIVMADISYIWKTKDYDVATVMNWNRIDPQTYGFVELNQIGINPMDYFNCGLVALRSKKFAHQWRVACFSPQFDRINFREQGILNILCYYGNYNVRCLDHQDELGGNKGWWGLIGKSELQFAKLTKNNEIVVPTGQGDTPYPPRDTQLMVLHFGGGSTPNKTNYRLFTQNEEVIKRLDYLISYE